MLPDKDIIQLEMSNVLSLFRYSRVRKLAGPTVQGPVVADIGPVENLKYRSDETCRRYFYS